MNMNMDPQLQAAEAARLLCSVYCENELTVIYSTAFHSHKVALLLPLFATGQHLKF